MVCIQLTNVCILWSSPGIILDHSEHILLLYMVVFPPVILLEAMKSASQSLKPSLLVTFRSWCVSMFVIFGEIRYPKRQRGHEQPWNSSHPLVLCAALHWANELVPVLVIWIPDFAQRRLMTWPTTHTCTSLNKETHSHKYFWGHVHTLIHARSSTHTHTHTHVMPALGSKHMKDSTVPMYIVVGFIDDGEVCVVLAVLRHWINSYCTTTVLCTVTTIVVVVTTQE